MIQQIKKAVSVVAPAVASILGGPIAGIATAKLASILTGNEQASDEEIYKALQSADTEAWLKIKQLEAETKQSLEKLQIESVADARKRETSIVEILKRRDYVIDFLALGTMLGVFSLIYMLFYHVIPDESKDIFYTAFGAAIGYFSSVINYYFGSSRGQQNLLNDKIKRGENG